MYTRTHTNTRTGMWHKEKIYTSERTRMTSNNFSKRRAQKCTHTHKYIIYIYILALGCGPRKKRDTWAKWTQIKSDEYRCKKKGTTMYKHTQLQSTCTEMLHQEKRHTSECTRMTSDIYIFAKKKGTEMYTHINTHNRSGMWRQAKRGTNSNAPKWHQINIILLKEEHNHANTHTNIHTLALGCDTSKREKHGLWNTRMYPIYIRWMMAQKEGHNHTNTQTRARGCDNKEKRHTSECTRMTSNTYFFAKKGHSNAHKQTNKHTH
jgi:hypothetical protein